MAEFALVASIDPDNPVEGDVRLVNGQLVLIEGTEAVSQHIRTRLQFFRGEWFLDVREGLPYFEEVYVKNPDLNVIRNLMREAVSGTPGVDSAPTVEVTLDTLTRQLAVSFIAVLDTGAVLTSQDFGPFILEV